ncbi:hypothetical protein WSM22_23320 [Cytophagales bacterium WSM2-2]|nr:hypothetical protein WSM22_23320 [Cytophagales bacterium WSM2-2]
MKQLLFVLVCLPLATHGQAVDSAQNRLSTASQIDEMNELAYHIRWTDREVSLKYAKLAHEASIGLNYRDGEAFALVTTGSYQLSKSAYEKSIESALSALKIFETTQNKKGLMRTYLLLGVTYRNLNGVEYAEDYLNRCLHLAQELKDNEEIARSYNSLGIIAQDQKDAAKALALFSKAMSYLPPDNKYVKANILGNIGCLYMTSKQTEQALVYFNEALQTAGELKNKSAQTKIHLKLGVLYQMKNDLIRAKEHFAACEELASQFDQKEYLMEVYKPIIEIKTKEGKLDEAYAYQVKLNQVTDSLFSIEKTRQIAALVTHYETDKKDQTIQLLKKDQEIQAIWRNVLIAGVVLASLLSLLIYRLQHSRSRKTRELLAFQQVLNDKLKELDGFKSQFFSTISHEFRTSLTLILAPAEEELKEKLPDSKRERFMLIKRNANRLLELVNQLLDLSKLEAGKMDLHVKEGDIEPLLKPIVSSFESWAQYKEIHFTKSIHLGKSVWFDREKIEKIVNNLLLNAFKVTPQKGTVSLLVDLFDSRNKKELSIIISDTGQGTPLNKEELAFSQFYLASNTIEMEGNGLGLTLVREMVKLYGGTITVQGNQDSGTTFYIKLPIDKESFSVDQIDLGHVDDVSIYPTQGPDIKSDRDEREPETDIEHEKDLVLIVEDNDDLLQYMSSMLNDKFNIVTAHNGEEACQMSLRLVPSLILTDLIMPKLDGLQLTQKIKADERTSHIPVILLTAKNELESRLEGLKTGADDYLTKPFSMEELLVRIYNLIEQRKRLAERFGEKTVVTSTLTPEASLDSKFLTRAKTVVEQCMSDFTFSVEKMADEMTLSRTQLLRKLKALTTMSPNEYIKDIRLKRAADLIQQRADTITQIGYTVGFNDQSYFTKCFKKKFGVTPRDYSLQFSKAKGNVQEPLPI